MGNPTYPQSVAAKEGTYLNFFRRQFFVTPPALPQSLDLSEQVGIVTGSNSGLGYEAVRQMLDRKLRRVIIAVRSRGKGEEARKELLRTYPKADIEVWELNLESHQSIQDFAKRCETLDRLDFAILNAGLMGHTFKKCKETGHEEIYQVNYIGTILLTILMLPILRQKAPKAQTGRLVVVGSETASWAKLTERHRPGSFLSQFDDPEQFDKDKRYPDSKLLQQLFLYELSNRLPKENVILSTVNPGFVATGFIKDTKGIQHAFVTMFKTLIGRKVEMGGRPLADSAVMKGPESHGTYQGDCVIKPWAEFVTSEEGKILREKLWHETIEDLSFAGVDKIIKEAQTVA